MDKKITFLFFSFYLVGIINLIAQENNSFTIPDVKLASIDGGNVSTARLGNDNNPFMICFWKTCCNSTMKFMQALGDVYPDFDEEYNLKVFAISVDDTRSSSTVKPLVNGMGWEFEVLLDPNEDFKRAMNVNLTPCYFIFDGNKNLVWQKSGYLQGDETEIEEVLIKIKNNTKKD